MLRNELNTVFNSQLIRKSLSDRLAAVYSVSKVLTVAFILDCRTAHCGLSNAVWCHVFKTSLTDRLYCQPVRHRTCLLITASMRQAQKAEAYTSRVSGINCRHVHLKL